MKLKTKIKIEMVITVFILLFLAVQITALITVSPPDTTRDFSSDGVYYHNSGGNVYFATNQSMKFEQIVLDESYVKFNNTGFYVDSDIRVNVSLVYIHEDILNASSYDTVLEFWSETYSGTVFYNVSGLKSNSQYNVSMNSTLFLETTTNETGVLSFNHTNASERLFMIGFQPQGAFSISSPYPANESTSVTRPPTNISISGTGTGFDVYIYYLNMTTGTNTTTMMKTWLGQDTSRLEIDTSSGYTNELIIGDTMYYWSVNASNGTTWINESYSYKTGGSRYDVTNSGDIVATDATVCWDNRSGETPYDVIYDVDWGGDVVATDVSLIWANRT